MKFDEYINEKVGFFDKESDYIIRELKGSEYEVSKWNKGKAPEVTYRCYKRSGSNSWSCTCPTKVRPCKHAEMVKKWIADGKPNPYDPKEISKWAKEMFNKEKR